jgi:hypothetical protein
MGAGVICERCTSPLEDGDLRCAVCALAVRHSAPFVDVARAAILRCVECGAAMAFDPRHQAPACAFCSAVMAVEQPADPVEQAQVRVPFGVDRELATASLRTWLRGRGILAPARLHDEAVLDRVTPIGWAAWIVDARAQVAWTADSDHGAARSSWAPHAGETHFRFQRIVIPASRGLTATECARLAPYYDLAAAQPIASPGFAGARSTAAGRCGVKAIASPGFAGARSTAAGRCGVKIDEAGVAVESFDLQRSAARRTVHQAIEERARSAVRREVPGRRVRNVRVACLVERLTTERAALPAWVLAYRFRGRPYRAIVHGQRAEIVLGSSPIDWAKLAWIAVAVATLAALVAWLV